MIAVSTLVWFFVTIIMMGFFAGLEMAFFSANRFGIELKKKQGKPGAELLSRFFENPEIFLGTSLIGYTISLVCFALTFSIVMQPLWNYVGLGGGKFDTFRLFVDIVLSGFIVLILAEFLPRSIFRAHSNVLLNRLVWIINIFYELLQPLASAFLGLSNW